MLLHGRSLATLRLSVLRSHVLRPTARRSFVLRTAVTAAAAIPLLAGCEAGLNAPVLHWHPPTAGTSVSIPAATGRGFIGIRNVFVIGGGLNYSLPAGSSAGVFLALTNTGARDRLVSVSAPGTATSVTLPAGGVTLERDHTQFLTGPEPEVVLRGLTHTLENGTDIRLVLTFQNAGSVRLSVPVQPRAAEYATYSPAPAPSPTATATPRHRHRGRAAASATPSPTASS
jgi:copper(I)-binding protein